MAVGFSGGHFLYLRGAELPCDPLRPDRLSDFTVVKSRPGRSSDDDFGLHPATQRQCYKNIPSFIWRRRSQSSARAGS